MLEKLNQNLQLGLGLIGIGREWGHTNDQVPSEEDVQTFLQSTYALGITYYDTAASYGTSEERLGTFLSKLTQEQRETIIVATKFGEYWNPAEKKAVVDHSFAKLKQSLDNSLKHLRKIDLLYLHKATIAALTSTEVEEAFAYAKTKGIHYFGASVSDEEAAKFVCKSDFYTVIQLPYNQVNNNFAEIIDLAQAKGKIVVINRPFNMGTLLYAEAKPHSFADKIAAYKFIMQRDFHGAILTGTKSISHLQENLNAFTVAQKALHL